jgi:hypothetical protein
MGEGNYSQRLAVHSDTEFLTARFEAAVHFYPMTVWMDPESSSAE